MERLLGTLSSVLLDFGKGNREWNFSSIRDILKNWRSLCSRKVHYQCNVCVCSMSHIWRSESNWWKLSFSCRHVGPRSQAQVISLGNSNPYPLSLRAFKIFFPFPIPLLERTQQTECNTPFQHLSSIPHISFDITPFPHPSAIRTNT